MYYNEVASFIQYLKILPDISEDDYSLEVVGSDDSKSFQLSLNDLKTKFSKHSLAASLQCAGNRRAEMNEV